jgi:hypothetical protein
MLNLREFVEDQNGPNYGKSLAKAVAVLIEYRLSVNPSVPGS